MGAFGDRVREGAVRARAEAGSSARAGMSHLIPAIVLILASGATFTLGGPIVDEVLPESSEIEKFIAVNGTAIAFSLSAVTFAWLAHILFGHRDKYSATAEQFERAAAEVDAIGR